MTIILGIDPGLQHTGWGLIQVDGTRLRFLQCGTIHTGKKPLAERLRILYDGLHKVIQATNPDEAAIEETFVNSNAQSSLKLGHARGALMLALSLNDIAISEYAARLVKKSVVGTGRAEKQQVEQMIKQLLPGASPDSADAADALAVAICHSSHRTLQYKTGNPA